MRKGPGQKPSLTLALSVEFPPSAPNTVAIYNVTETYPGYFNTEKCYSVR